MAPHHASEPRQPKTQQGGAAVAYSDLHRLEERTVLITGGCGGIGLVIASTVLELGGDVVTLDLPAVPPKIEWECLVGKAEKYGGRVTYHSCDVTDESAVKQTFETFASSLRYPLRAFLSCVGVSATGPSVDFPANDFKRLLDINIMGTYVVAQAVAREMRNAALGGSMVFIASMSGWVANKGADSSAYNTAKCALHQLARSLASEWGSRASMPLIRVNTVSPGYIRTAATAEALEIVGIEESWAEQNMLYRICEPDELRGPIMFLLTDAGSFVTAADLRVDGGHCAW